MRFIVFIVTFLLQSQSQPIQETIESETEIVCPDGSSEVNCSNDDGNISRNDDDSIIETSEKNDNGKTKRFGQGLEFGDYNSVQDTIVHIA